MSPSHSPWVVDVSEADFDTQVIQQSREKPVVVDLWAPGCAPCRLLGPLLERVVGERGGDVVLAKVNTEENQRLAAQFQIRSIPLVIAFRDGKPFAEFTGLLPEDQLREFLSQVLPSAAEKLAREAATLENSDPERAVALYRRALEADPRLDSAIVGLARGLVAQHKDVEAARLLADAVVGGDYSEEAERLKGVLALREAAREFGDEASIRKQLEADSKSARLHYELGCVLAAHGRYKEALDLLLAAGERDPRLASSAVRERMVQIFHMVGNHSELANEYRRRLTALLY